jgi:hypothetical protein
MTRRQPTFALAHWPWPKDSVLRALDAGMFQVADAIPQQSMWWRLHLCGASDFGSRRLRLRNDRTKTYWCPMRRRAKPKLKAPKPRKFGMYVP